MAALLLTSVSARAFAGDAEHRTRPLRILQIRGLHFQYYRLDEAAQLLRAEPIKVSYGYHKAFEGKRGVTYFPSSASEMAQFDAVVMNDTPIHPRPTAQLGEPQLKILCDYVQNGGVLLVIGGHNAFAGGGYGQSLLAELLPVDVKERFDVEWLKPPVALSAVGDHFADLDWRKPPVVVWMHRFAGVKPGAETLLTAGNDPAIVIWRWHKGRVGVVATTCYGIPSKGQVGFWDWKEWPKVVAATLERLTDKSANGHAQ